MELDAICATLGIDPLAHGLQVLDAAQVVRQHFPPIDPDIPVLIARLDSSANPIQCAQRLLLLYPREHEVTFLSGDKSQPKQLGELARAVESETPDALYIPPLTRPGSFNALANIVAHLRAPEGCPWDRAQTHQSLRKDFLEECYEVLETLDQNDILHLREELGDLLLHILLQAQIAFEANEFGLSEMIAEISEKLVRRHPHVFGNVVVSGTDEIVANWQKIKDSEKRQVKSELANHSDIPHALPALARAQKIARREKKSTSGKEIQRLVGKLLRARKKQKALGEALFALATYAVAHGIDAEGALRTATLKE